MYECRCPHDGKKLAEIARPPIYTMTGGQLCACGRWVAPRIDLKGNQIVRTVQGIVLDNCLSFPYTLSKE